jgi:hypothetical protein
MGAQRGSLKGGTHVISPGSEIPPWEAMMLEVFVDHQMMLIVWSKV